MMQDLELFDEIFKKLDELTQLYQDIEDRVRWIEEVVRLSKSGVHVGSLGLYEWLSGKVDA
ncbi:MAG: hypothetical protein AB1638_00375 [Nitrospirota bacterium]